MNCQKPIFSPEEHSSIIGMVSALHSYFRDLQSYYKILKGQVISNLEYSEQPETIEELKNQLDDINRKLKYIHVLNNSASTVDEVIHFEEMLHEFRQEVVVLSSSRL